MKVLMEINDNLTKNVSYKEVVYSYTAIRKGIDNTPTYRQLKVIEHMAVNFIQPLRELLGVALKFNSIFRAPKLNRAVGGSKGSDHQVKGDTAAVDIDDTYSIWMGVDNREIFFTIYENFDFYKLIWEYDGGLTKDGKKKPAWVHVSFSTDPAKNKKKIVLHIDEQGVKQFDFKLI